MGVVKHVEDHCGRPNHRSSFGVFRRFFWPPPVEKNLCQIAYCICKFDKGWKCNLFPSWYRMNVFFDYRWIYPDDPPNHFQSQCPDDPLPTPPTVFRSTSDPPPPVCNFVSYILMWVYTVDLHRPATRRRRRVELMNPAVYIPSTAHQCRAPNTYRTNTCLQSHTVKPPLQRRSDVVTGWAEGNRSLTPVRTPSLTSDHHPPTWW
jgi:hypothetical protein